MGRMRKNERKGRRKSGRKDGWKHYRTAILIESVMLCIMLFLGYLLYQMEWSKVCSESYSAVNNLDGWKRDCPAGLRGDSTDMLMYHILNRVPQYEVGAETQEESDCYGLYVELYDSEGNVMVKTTSHVLALGWYIWETVEDEGTDPSVALIFPENYFTEEQMEELYAWIMEEKGPNNWVRVRNMTGYYGENQEFIPVKITFFREISDGEVHSFILENRYDEEHSRKLVCRGEQFQQVEGLAVDEEGYIALYHCSVDTKANEAAEKLMKTGGRTGLISGPEIVNGENGGGYYDNSTYFMTGILEESEAAGYAITMCIDNRYLTLHSSNFIGSVLKMLIFCQGLALLLIGMVQYFQKKERKVKKMRDLFLNAIAHEMKTPVAVIQNSVECLQAGIYPEKQEHYQELIGQEAGHMDELLNNMLVYTRVSDTTCELQKESCSLEELTGKVCRQYLPLMQNRNIVLKTERAEPEPVDCDIRLMEMVIDNFVSNAVKNCRDKGVIRIRTEKNGIRIFNEGEHIPPECAKHIWEPLYKVDKSRTETKKCGCMDPAPGSRATGTGMGLAVSEAILKLHGAEYGMENVPGGVEFYFRLANV
ncbi:MAG: sensor histidine kinase [Lachnospiraceae bacterium]